MWKLSINTPQKAALSCLAGEAPMSWAATGCKLQGRTSSILFWEELDCVGCCQFQPEHTTLPRDYWGTSHLRLCFCLKIRHRCFQLFGISVFLWNSINRNCWCSAPMKAMKWNNCICVWSLMLLSFHIVHWYHKKSSALIWPCSVEHYKRDPWDLYMLVKLILRNGNKLAI